MTASCLRKTSRPRVSQTRRDGGVIGFSYDALNRITKRDLRTGGGLDVAYGYDNLGRLTSAVQTGNSMSFSWDALGRKFRRSDERAYRGLTCAITGQAGTNYLYTSENLLRTASGVAPIATLAYDLLMRLDSVIGNASNQGARFAYDGLDMIAEYNAAGALQKRYVFGPGIDEPIVEYDASGTRTWLTADERGSIVARSNDVGTVTTINRYDEFGVPQSTNAGRFQYTGQMWVPELSAYYYKARVYEPEIGRFLQPDVIGYAGGMNLYAYVRNDPVNLVDPLGLQDTGPDIVVCGNCDPPPPDSPPFDIGDYLQITGFDLASLISELREPEIVVIGVRLRRSWQDFVRGVSARYCALTSMLPDNGRVRLGADLIGYGGIGGVAGGSIVSVNRNGSLSSDFYIGWGAGLGSVATGGVSIANDASPAGRSVDNAFGVTGAYSIFGISGYHSRVTRQNSVSGGIGPGIGVVGSPGTELEFAL